MHHLANDKHFAVLPFGNKGQLAFGKAVHQNDDNKDEENDFFDEEDETPIELDIQYNKDAREQGER